MVATGERALEYVAEREFHVALLDIKMPGLSGIDVLRQLHASQPEPETSVVMISAVADLEIAVEAMKLGAYDYVIKPFNLDDLLMRVEKARERKYLAVQMREFNKNIEERMAQQSTQLREMVTQTVQALIREEALASELEAERGKGGSRPQAMDIKEFGTRVFRCFRGTRK
jgi:DNA-binding NtrC family response regulator